MVLTLNRPESLNALSSELLAELISAVRACDVDDQVGAVILTGAGDRAFTAGLDLKEAAAPGTRKRSANPVEVIAACSKPVVAAVNGLCITGGLEIILGCDMVLAADTARFADTHVRVGLLPGWGLSQRLVRQVGPHRAKEISLAGNFITAARAYELGLVNRVVDSAALMPEALALANDIAGANSAVVPEYKRLIDDGFAMPLGEALVMERERGQAWSRSMAPTDFASGQQVASERNRAQLQN